MKSSKILWIALVIFLSYGEVYSQSLSFGPKIGFNYANFPSSASMVTNDAGKLGLQAGLFARIGKKTFLQPEILFGSYSGSFNLEGSNSVQNVHFTTANIPVLLGHKLISFPLASLRAMIGPDFAFQLKKPGLQIPSVNDYSYKDATVGGIVGLGVDVLSFTLDARYNFGLSEINPTLGQKLNSFNISIGFKFL